MIVKTLPIHANGHRVTPDDAPDVTVYFLNSVPGVDFPEDMQTMINDTFGCGWCGKRPKMRVEGDAVYIDELCPLPNGTTTVTTLEVPSGKILVKDDLRAVYDGFDHDGFADYNSVLGQAQVIQAMAKLGCAFGPVGNSCPGLWKTGEDTYMIGRLPLWDEEKDEELPIPPGITELAAICTDLWAYCVADYADWLSKGGLPVEELGYGATVVEIPAGTYEFTHHSGEKDFDDRAEDTVFADIKRIA